MKRIRIAVILIALIGFCGGGANAESHVRIQIWNLIDTDDFHGFHAAINKYQQERPYLEIERGTPGGQGGMDPQKLMTAVAAKTPPDIVYADRFQVGGWAARGAFLPLDEFIQRDQIDIDQFYPAAWLEASYHGHVYAIPHQIDDRGLYINRDSQRRAGMDPDRPPRNWAELKEYAKRLTQFDPEHGAYETIGFAPNYGNSWLYLYGWLNGGRFMTPDGTRVTLNDPRIIEALRWMVDTYDAIGGAARVKAFEESSQRQGLGDPFISGKLAMMIDGNWYLEWIGRSKPDLDFYVVPPPPPEGKKSVSWSGGFSWVIPVGAPHPQEAWELIKWLNSPEGWLYAAQKQLEFYAKERGHRYYVPLLAARRDVNRTLMERYIPALPPNLQAAHKVFIDMLDTCHFRPVTPIGQELWDEHARAADAAFLHELSPKEALDRGTLRAQKKLDQVLHPPQYPKVSARKVIVITIVALVAFLTALGAVFWFRIRAIPPQERRESLAGISFITPWAVGFLLLMALPMMLSFLLAFSEYDVLHAPRFAGLDNFREMLGFVQNEEGTLVPRDRFFWKSLWNTCYLAFGGVPLGMGVGLILALLLNREVRGIGVYRTLFYMPVIVPLVASAILWMWMLNPETGLANWTLDPLLRLFGLEAPNWFGDQHWAKPGVLLMLAWAAGGSMIIWLAGLKSIPNHLYESAAIDGAGRRARFLSITIPLLTPYIFFNLVMGIIANFQIFTQVYVISSPASPTAGPNDSLLTFVYYLFLSGFNYFRMGYASALAWVLFAIIFSLCLIQIKLAPRWVHYE